MCVFAILIFLVFFKQKTAYALRISDWSSDVCSSDLRGYHGVGFGGISVGGIVGNRRQFGTLLTGVDHMRHTHDLARNAHSRGLPAHGAELADDLERIVALHGADTIADRKSVV